MNYGMHGVRGSLALHKRADILLRWKLIRWNKGQEESPFISLTDLCRRLAEITGMDPRSIYYSLTGTAKNRLTCSSHPVQKSWAYTIHPATGEVGFVLRKSEEFMSGRYKENKPDYNNPEKDQARNRGFGFFLNIARMAGLRNPRILTLGGEEGYCVKALLQHFPEANIVSLEHDKSIRKRFKANFAGSPNVKSVPGELDEFVVTDPLDFDFLNLDAMGYMCRKAYDRFVEVNKKTTAPVVTVTLEYQREIRNTGEFQDTIRTECPETPDNPNPDQVRYALEKAFTRYAVVDDYKYSGHRKHMRMFVLAKKC